MSIRRPDLGPAGRAELDEPQNPLGPADRGALVGDENWPLGTPRKRQRTAGGVRQPLGTERDDPAHIPGERPRRREELPGAQPGEREDLPGVHRRGPLEDPGDEPVIGDPDREDDRREDPGTLEE